MRLEQEYKERLGTVRSELLAEVEQIQQQAGLQREELEAELDKSRADECFMRDRLSVSIKVQLPSVKRGLDLDSDLEVH